MNRFSIPAELSEHESLCGGTSGNRGRSGGGGGGGSGSGPARAAPPPAQASYPVQPGKECVQGLNIRSLLQMSLYSLGARRTKDDA